jgi:acyl carrier protein
LITQTWEDFASVLSAKVEGARLLHRHTAGRTLDHFVLFSTSAALIGNLGQTNHAAANAYLDALAEARHAAGLPGLSIDWGAWGETGAVVAGDYARAMASHGVRPIRTANGLEALGRAMADGTRARLGFVDLDWPVFLAGYGGKIPPFLTQVAPSSSARPAGGAGKARSGPARDFRSPLTAAEPDKRRAVLADLLRAEAAEVLGLDDPARIDDGQALNEIGLDSLLALELRNRLGAALGAQQPATLLFNYPSVSALTDHVAEAFGDLMTAIPDAASRDAASAERMLVEEVMAMSDDDIEAFLDQELAAIEARP